MAFKSYNVVAQANGTWLLEQPAPLRFSGPQGLIAQWYRAHRLEAEGAWMVSAPEWLALALGAEGEAQRWIIFDQVAGGVCKYARLERIHGQFGAQTRLMLQFRPLQCLGTGLPLIVAEPENVCGWSEELSIDGGDGSSGCTWRWMAPKLGFASVVAGGVPPPV